MKTKKLLDRLHTLLNADQRAQLKQEDAIKELLEKLHKKERHFKENLALVKDKEQRDKLERKISVCHAQRKKGLELLKQLKAPGESDAP